MSRKRGAKSVTITEYLQKRLEDNGMFPEEASQTIEAAKTSPLFVSMEHRWDEQLDSYPEPMKAVLWPSMKRVGADWLAQNAPEHWARPLFSSEVPA